MLWSFHIICPKKMLQMVVNYHTFNDQTIKHHHLLPYIYDLSDQLAYISVFVSIDLVQECQNICILEEDAPKMAFKTLCGHYQF